MRDAIAMQNVMSGPSLADPSSLRDRVVLTGDHDIRGWHIAYSIDLGHKTVDPEVEAATRATIDRLRDLGCTTEEVALDWDDRIRDAFEAHHAASDASASWMLLPSQRACSWWVGRSTTPRCFARAWRSNAWVSRYDDAMDERKACAVLKARFEKAGFTIEENQPFDEGGVQFEIDGFDAERRVGYEYITEEAGDGWDVDGAVIAALDARRKAGELYVLVVDERDAPDDASLGEAIDVFLDGIPKPAAKPVAKKAPAKKPAARKPAAKKKKKSARA